MTEAEVIRQLRADLAELKRSHDEAQKSHARVALWVLGDGEHPGLVLQFSALVAEFKSLKGIMRWGLGMLATTAVTEICRVALHFV